MAATAWPALTATMKSPGPHQRGKIKEPIHHVPDARRFFPGFSGLACLFSGSAVRLGTGLLGFVRRDYIRFRLAPEPTTPY